MGYPVKFLALLWVDACLCLLVSCLCLSASLSCLSSLCLSASNSIFLNSSCSSRSDSKPLAPLQQFFSASSCNNAALISAFALPSSIIYASNSLATKSVPFSSLFQHHLLSHFPSENFEAWFQPFWNLSQNLFQNSNNCTQFLSLFQQDLVRTC